MQPETEKLANLLTGFFLAKQAEGCSSNTIIEYKKDFAHFAQWCNAHGKNDPTAITAGSIPGSGVKGAGG